MWTQELGGYDDEGQIVTAGSPPSPEAVALFLRINRNSRVQAGLTVATTAVAFVGSFALLQIAGHFGLHHPSAVFRGWLATFDYVNFLFAFLFGSFLSSLRVHDGTRYLLSFGSHRPSRTAWSGGVIFLTFLAMAVAWGELAVRPVLNGRAHSADYIDKLSWGQDQSLLIEGVAVLLVGYYLVMGAILLIHLIGLRFNPVDDATFRSALPGRGRMSKSSSRS